MEKIIGIIGKENASLDIFNVFSFQQFDVYGIASYDGNIHQKKGVGNIYEIFESEDMVIKKLPGDSAIGYAGDVIEIPENVVTEEEKRKFASHNAQPEYQINPFIVGVNRGKILNFEESIKGLKNPRSESSVQPLLINLSESLKIPFKKEHKIDEYDIFSASRRALYKTKGSRSSIFITDTSDTGENTFMFSITDPHGIYPMFLGEKDGSFCFSSDRISLMELGYKKYQEIEPGSVVIVNKYGLKKAKRIMEGSKKPCILGFIHTMEPNCTVGGKNIHDIRFEIGRKLFQKYPVLSDVICSTPEGEEYAEGFSYESNIPHYKGIKKVGEKKELGKPKKSIFIPIKPVVEDKNVALIVHRITNDTKNAIKTLKEIGNAKEINVYAASPPPLSKCYFGSNYESYNILHNGELTTRKDISEELNADSLNWLTVDELKETIGDVCTGCLEIIPDGYPNEMKDYISSIHYAKKF